MSSARPLNTTTTIFADALKGSAELKSLFAEILDGYESMITANLLTNVKGVMNVSPDVLARSSAACVGQLSLIENFRSAVLRPANRAASSTTQTGNFV